MPAENNQTQINPSCCGGKTKSRRGEEILFKSEDTEDAFIPVFIEIVLSHSTDSK